MVFRRCIIAVALGALVPFFAAVVAQDKDTSVADQEFVDGKLVKKSTVSPKATAATPVSAGKFVLWTNDSPTGHLIGSRRWLIDQDSHGLYIAISTAEARAIAASLYAKPMDSAWDSAFADGFVKSAWTNQAKYPEPTFMLRMDRFEEFKPTIDKVHSGNLPWQVTRSDSDDPSL